MQNSIPFFALCLSLSPSPLSLFCCCCSLVDDVMCVIITFSLFSSHARILYIRSYITLRTTATVAVAVASAKYV